MKKFLTIAASLGIAVPISLAAANSPKTTSSVDERMEQSNDNEIVQRINLFYSSDAVVDVTSMAHTNSHTDVGGNHTNYHSNLAHTNHHTNATPKNACGHTDVHTDRDGNDSHTNYGRSSHTDHHTNKEC